MKKVRKTTGCNVVTEPLKTKASNFFNWILALTGSQWSVLSSDVARAYGGQFGQHDLYALKFIQFDVRETSKKRITPI